MAQAVTVPNPAATQGPSAVTLEARLPATDLGCIVGTDRRGRYVDMCIQFTPHVRELACREAPDLGGHVCDYVVDYFDDRHGLAQDNTLEVRSELFARDPETPAGWRFVREVAPMHTQRRPRRRHG
jgi:hypothetical protein